MRQTRLYKSSRITLLSYLVSQLEHSLLSPCFATDNLCHGKSSPCQGVRDPLPVLIYRGFLPINLQLTRASKTAILLRDNLNIKRALVGVM
jgi:hypothetical protein